MQQAMQNGIAIVAIHGPIGSPYEGYTFRLSYDGREGPYIPPVIQFIQIPWNPYICPETGNICCDILKPINTESKIIQGWSPALTLQSVVLSIISLLGQKTIPQNQPGLNIQAAVEMRLKYSSFFNNARQLSQKDCYKKQVHYKDEQKYVQKNPEDIEKSDIQFMKGKDKFINDPQIKKIHIKKIAKMPSTNQVKKM